MIVSSFDNSKSTFYRTKLDGIDIDVHDGEKSYYADFVIKLREYMNTSTDKKYLLTASPKCLYPNRILGDAFKKHSDKSDFLFLDTDDSLCNLKNEDRFSSSLRKWLALPGPEIFFTIPADERVADQNSSYITRAEVNATIQVKYFVPFSILHQDKAILVLRQQDEVYAFLHGALQIIFSLL